MARYIFDCDVSASGTGAIGIRASVDMTALYTLVNATTDLVAAGGATLSVQACDYATSSGAIEPTTGDRAVYDALGYQARHANDINNALGIHHTLADLNSLYQPLDATLTTLSALADAAGALTNNGAGVLSWVVDSDTTVATDAIWDAKGDTVAATGADAAVRVPVGTDGQVLTADSASTAGVKWADTVTLAPINIYNETQSADGTSTIYYLANYAAPSTIRVYIDGIRQPASDDVAPTDVVSFGVAPDAGAVLLFDYEMDQ